LRWKKLLTNPKWHLIKEMSITITPIIVHLHDKGILLVTLIIDMCRCNHHKVEDFVVEGTTNVPSDGTDPTEDDTLLGQTNLDM
jgi:hypothetical protein